MRWEFKKIFKSELQEKKIKKKSELQGISSGQWWCFQILYSEKYSLQKGLVCLQALTKSFIICETVYIWSSEPDIVSNELYSYVDMLKDL